MKWKENRQGSFNKPAFRRNMNVWKIFQEIFTKNDAVSYRDFEG